MILYTSSIQVFIAMQNGLVAGCWAVFFPSGGRGRIVARWLRYALDGVWRVVFFGPDTCETRQGTALWVMMVMAWHSLPHGCFLRIGWTVGTTSGTLVYLNHTSLMCETLFKGIEIGRKKEHRELKNASNCRCLRPQRLHTCLLPANSHTQKGICSTICHPIQGWSLLIY